MNKSIETLALAGMLLLANSVGAQDKNFYVFLCLGQSNMEGFPGIEDQDRSPGDSRFQVLATVDFQTPERKAGNWYPAVPPLCRPSAGLCPADFFGRSLVAQLPKEIKVGVVNVAVAGCKIELFDKQNYSSYAATAPEWMKTAIAAYDGNPYQKLVDMGRVAQKSGVIKGILLHQGESNTGDEQWPAKVRAVYMNLLKDLDLKAEEVPLIAGEVVGTNQKGLCASMNQIIARLPTEIPTAHIVSSKGCVVRSDNLHFSPEGYRELGRRYAQAMLPLLGHDSARVK